MPPSPWSLSRVAERATSKLALSNFLSGRRLSVENGERDTSFLGENSSNGPAERLHRSPETRRRPRNVSCREGNYRCRARGSCERRRALLRRAAQNASPRYRHRCAEHVPTFRGAFARTIRASSVDIDGLRDDASTGLGPREGRRRLAVRPALAKLNVNSALVHPKRDLGKPGRARGAS